MYHCCCKIETYRGSLKSCGRVKECGSKAFIRGFEPGTFSAALAAVSLAVRRGSLGTSGATEAARRARAAARSAARRARAAACAVRASLAAILSASLHSILSHAL